MRALIVTNCATAAYTSGLRALFPDWQVKGADLALARKWLCEEPNTAFGEFLAATELLVIPRADEPLFADRVAGKDLLLIPHFYFWAFHPDSFHLSCGARQVPSVLGSGNLHSRIAAAAYLLGLQQDDAIAAFEARVYERIGYLSVFDSEKTELFDRFAAQGIDIAGDFQGWMRDGNFLYTYNHPRAFVFNDILLRALRGRTERTDDMRAALGEVPDYLEPAIRWPVYPQIAQFYGFESELVWRTGTDLGPKWFGLDEFIAHSFEIFRTFPELNGDCIPGFDQCRDALTAT